MSEKPNLVRELMKELGLGVDHAIRPVGHDFGPRGEGIASAIQESAMEDLRKPYGEVVDDPSPPVLENPFLNAAGRMIEIVMIGGIVRPHEHFIDKIRKLRDLQTTGRVTEARQMARKRLDAGFHLSQDEYSQDEYSEAMDELIQEMKGEQIEAVNLVREENAELRAQVEARDTLDEQDKVIRSLVRPKG